MSSPVIVAVAPGSPGASPGSRPVTRSRAIDGQRPRDVIEWQFATDAADIELDIVRGGIESTLDGRQAEGEPLGVEVQSAVFDRVRTCDNHCEFCFIYQLPKGMRRSLYLKDDDYRLSFLYGNFTTLTRFTESDLERVITERLSPLHVSIHATDHDIRNRMLKNQRGGMSLRWLRALLDQRDRGAWPGRRLPRHQRRRRARRHAGGRARRLSRACFGGVVPLGLSKFNKEPAMRLHTPQEAARVVDIVERWQATFLARARAPDGVRRRRVLPDDGPPVPAAPTTTRASRCTRTGSAWRERSSSSSKGRR